MAKTNLSELSPRSERKKRHILQIATKIFLENGYDATTMDKVAEKAKVSKPTVYRFFSDKQCLFAEIILSNTDQVQNLLREMTEILSTSSHLEEDFLRLAKLFLKVLMNPQMLRLRRLIIANAERFPKICAAWFEQGFERVIALLAESFEKLARTKQLRIDDPTVSAHHFAGMLLWIPMNQAMFGIDKRATEAELEKYARSAVQAFLKAYS